MSAVHRLSSMFVLVYPITLYSRYVRHPLTIKHIVDDVNLLDSLKRICSLIVEKHKHNKAQSRRQRCRVGRSCLPLQNVS